MKLNKRGKRVRALLILAGVILLVLVAGRLWWTDSGWCWGSMAQCVGI
jgi:hypothetical protein